MKNLKLAARETTDRTTVSVGDIKLGRGFVVIAGPCSVENEHQIMDTALAVIELAEPRTQIASDPPVLKATPMPSLGPLRHRPHRIPKFRSVPPECHQTSASMAVRPCA